MLGSSTARDGKRVVFTLSRLSGLSKAWLADWGLKCQEGTWMGR